MLQRFLTKLTPEQLEQQRERIAAEAAVSAAAAAADAAAAAARQSETGPGRPRKEKSIIPASASVCSASGSDEEMDPVPEATKKRAYTSWLTSDDFHYIHDTVRRRQSFRGAVRELITAVVASSMEGEMLPRQLLQAFTSRAAITTGARRKPCRNTLSTLSSLSDNARSKRNHFLLSLA